MSLEGKTLLIQDDLKMDPEVIELFTLHQFCLCFLAMLVVSESTSQLISTAIRLTLHRCSWCPEDDPAGHSLFTQRHDEVDFCGFAKLMTPPCKCYHANAVNFTPAKHQHVITVAASRYSRQKDDLFL